jgi:DNA-binding MarR family transcriptional regulator
MVRQESNYVTRGELTLPQQWALETLRREGPHPMHDLLAKLQLKASTGTVFVDRLCRMKLVRRERSERDRRVIQVTLAARGRRVLDEIDRTRRASMLAVFSRLNPRERRTYLKIIEKLARQLSNEKDTP